MGLRDWIWQRLAPDDVKARLQALPTLFSPFQTGRPLYGEWDSEKAIRDGLKASVIVYRAVTLKAKAASSVPWVAYMKPRGTGSKRTRVEGHELEGILANPMRGLDIRPRFSGQDLIEAMVGYLDLAGKTGIYLQGLKRDGRFTNMRMMLPHRMLPVLDQHRGIVQWQYQVDGTYYPVAAEQVHYTRYADPASEWDGLSPLKAMARVVDTDVESVNANYFTLTNMGVPPGAMFSKAPLDQPIKESNRREWAQNYSGKNRGKMPFLDGTEWGWVRFGLTPQELLLIETRKMNWVEICVGLGVPTELMGIQDQKTYNNYKEGKKALWEDTLIPLLDDIKDGFNTDLAPRWDDRLEVEPDLSNVPALQEDQDAKVKRVVMMTGNALMALDKGQEELGLDPDPQLKGVYLVPFSATLTKDPGAKADEADKPPELQPKVPGPEEEPADGEQPGGSDKPTEGKGLDPGTEEGRTAYWVDWDNRVHRMGAALAGQVAAEFSVETDEFKAALSKPGAMANWESEVDSVLAKARSRWVTLLAATGVAAVQEFGTPVFTVLKAQSGKSRHPPQRKDSAVPLTFDPYALAIQEYLAKYTAQHVTFIEVTTGEAVKGMIKEILGKGWDEGQTIREITSALGELPELSMARGEMIAQTEMTALANYGSLQGAVQSGVDALKRWLSSRDPRVRETHTAADKAYSEKGIPLNEPFTVGGYKLMHPGDSNMGAPAKEVIRCR